MARGTGSLTWVRISTGVGEHGYAHGLLPLAHLTVDGAYHAAVQVLYRAQFQGQIAVVASLVACLYVQKHEVVGAESLKRCGGLALVVGVGQAGGARHLDDAQTGIVADALDEVYRRYHSSTAKLGIGGAERFHVGAVAWAPGPDRVGRHAALCLPLQVEGMLAQQLLRAQDEPVDEVGGLLGAELSFLVGALPGWVGFHQKRLPCFVGVVVRRSAHHMLVAAAYHQQVAVLDAGYQLHALVAERLVQRQDEPGAFLGGQMPSVVVHDATVGQRDDVAAHGHVVGAHLVATSEPGEKPSGMVMSRPVRPSRARRSILGL